MQCFADASGTALAFVQGAACRSQFDACSHKSRRRQLLRQYEAPAPQLNNLDMHCRNGNLLVRRISTLWCTDAPENSSTVTKPREGAAECLGGVDLR
jgi:hypothetical protein